MEISDVVPGQAPELAEFLSSAFGTSADSFFLRKELLFWKYFQERPDWKGSRSKVVREDGRMVAHAGIWPLGFLLPGGPVDCIHLIDWGAAGAAGAGVLLYRDMLRSAPAAIVVGGAMGARKLLTRMGFAQAGRVDQYVRAVRPWRQFRSRSSGPAWKNAAKWVRNTGWSLSGLAAHREWTAEARPQFPGELEPLLAKPMAESCTPGRRTVDVLNFLLLCPGVSCRAYLLKHTGELRGYFLLCRAGGQSRIADLRVWGSGVDWAAGYAAAVEAASEDPETCEIVASSSVSVTAAALASNGFRICGQRPLWLYDPQHLFAGAPPLHVQGIESDSFFLCDVKDHFAS